jgi:hypothetical protein
VCVAAAGWPSEGPRLWQHVCQRHEGVKGTCSSPYTCLCSASLHSLFHTSTISNGQQRALMLVHTTHSQPYRLACVWYSLCIPATHECVVRHLMIAGAATASLAYSRRVLSVSNMLL